MLYEAISLADTLKRDGGSYQCSLVLIPSYNMLERRKNLNPNYPQTQLPVGIEAIANLFSPLYCILFFFMQRRVRKAWQLQTERIIKAFCGFILMRRTSSWFFCPTTCKFGYRRNIAAVPNYKESTVDSPIQRKIEKT